MTRLVPLIVLLFLLPAASVLAGDLPQVLQPNTTAYSASEVAVLTQAIATLTEPLNNFDMASRRYFSASGWSSRDFAMYTAGVLSQKGYETLLVSGDGWPDGTHTWVLVGISLGTKTAWVPVEASPDQGHSQQILGSIPSTTDAAGSLWFDARYVSFGNVIDLPPNVPPIARIRKPVSALVESKSSRILGMTSVDPDGEIVLYKWDFGDGDSETAITWTVRHVFEKPGDYTVHLTVIGSRGATASTSLVVRVLSTAEANQPSGGCGCGK
ncbi:MAG: PKD domain-containing protein [Candidatus Thorarchaeota archaeon]